MTKRHPEGRRETISRLSLGAHHYTAAIMRLFYCLFCGGRMAAPKGNRFWEARSSHGRSPKFESPDDLWDACCEYFQWVEDNPLWEMKAFSYQGEVTQEPIAKMRAMTLTGLCLFLDIADSTWQLYRSREDYMAVTTRAEKVITELQYP